MLGFKRFLALLALPSALVWLGSAPAFAAGNPGREPLPAPPDVVAPLCGDALGMVVAHISVERQYIKSFTKADGTLKLQINGFAAATFTGNGKTITINGSGPGSITFFPDGTVDFVLEGHTVYLQPPTGGAWLYTGRAVFDPFTGTVIGHTGAVKDICAQLR